ncbi:hypothetical protein [Streptomyces sp. NPDC006668]|uniref:hypothetical protein n=1 Tax=Streptomyces sp. NPDC006668 TaxID=3156903 RepID=UPI0034055C3F
MRQQGHAPRPAQRLPQLPAPVVLCGAALTPGHRIGVFVVILLVLTVHVTQGQSMTSALGIVMAAGAAAQIGSWLSEQRLTATSAGGA